MEENPVLDRYILEQNLQRGLREVGRDLSRTRRQNSSRIYPLSTPGFGRCLSSAWREVTDGPMRVCSAQTRPIKGDIPANIDGHLKLLDLAIARKTDAVVFPELSFTGYEPELAQDLATPPDDTRLDVFQPISNRHAVIVCVGTPIQTEAGCTSAWSRPIPMLPVKSIQKPTCTQMKNRSTSLVPGRIPRLS